MAVFLIIFGILLMIVLLKAEMEYINNYKLYRNIVILYIITTIIIFINVSNISKGIAKINMYDKIIFFIGSMSISLIADALLVKGYQVYKEKITIKMIEKKIQGEKFEYIYYRDILNKYPPAILAFLYNKKIRLDDVIVSTILNLEKRNIIEIENTKIKLNKNIEDLDIKRYEKDILLYCTKKDKNDKKNFEKKLCFDIEDDALGLKLIYTGNSKEFNATYIMELFMAWLIIYILFTILFFVEVTTLGLWLIAFYVLTFACSSIYKGIQLKINPIIRTKEGIEIKAKLNGLKRYIEEFSNIQNDSIRKFELFDDYVIYAIICNLPGKLNNEVRNLFNEIRK